MRIINKNDFTAKTLLKLKPEKQMTVQCESFPQMESTKQMCYNAIKRYPRTDITRYATVLNSDKMTVTISAVV